MREKAKCQLTQFGFDWGPAEVTRLYERSGQVVLGIRAWRGYLEVRVTRTGYICINHNELPKKPRGPIT